MTEATRILSAIEQGDPRALEQLLPLAYDELRLLAAAKMVNERPGQTPEAMALVHEACLRLVARRCELEGHDPGAARLVKPRSCGGLSHQDVAEALGRAGLPRQVSKSLTTFAFFRTRSCSRSRQGHALRPGAPCPRRPLAAHRR